MKPKWRKKKLLYGLRYYLRYIGLIDKNHSDIYLRNLETTGADLLKRIISECKVRDINLSETSYLLQLNSSI